ncbi:MAG: hypothetical protein WCT46_00655 [Candidatus Gracilibacteria bacterium]|jgi:hypothetical protein
MGKLLAALIDVSDQPVTPIDGGVANQSSTTMEFVVTILNFAFSLAGFIGTIGLLPFSALGVYFLIKNSSEKDVIKKKSLIKKAVIFLLLPWCLIFGAFAGYYIVSLMA